ncbi:MAG: BhlA/UviB family holin-like peptide [Armatimonadota bacterium]
MCEAEVTRLLIGQGPFAVLFVILLFYVLKEGSKREERLMQFFAQFSEEHKQQAESLAQLDTKLDRVLNGIQDMKQRV